MFRGIIIEAQELEDRHTIYKLLYFRSQISHGISIIQFNWEARIGCLWYMKVGEEVSCFSFGGEPSVIDDWWRPLERTAEARGWKPNAFFSAVI